MMTVKELKRFPLLLKNPVFTLRVKLGAHTAVIRVFEGPFREPNHTRLFCELRYCNTVLFPAKDFYVEIPGKHAIDSDYAKETVLSLFALKPGDTDGGFFADYTPEQLDFVNEFGDELSMIKEERYGTF